MKRGLFVAILVVGILTCASVSAFAELKQVYADVQDGWFVGHADVDPHGEERLVLQWYIPELGVWFERRHIDDDHEDGTLTQQPLDVPAGDYLMRVTLRNDDDSAVVYRYLTVS